MVIYIDFENFENFASGMVIYIYIYDHSPLYSGMSWTFNGGRRRAENIIIARLGPQLIQSLPCYFGALSSDTDLAVHVTALAHVAVVVGCTRAVLQTGFIN